MATHLQFFCQCGNYVICEFGNEETRGAASLRTIQLKHEAYNGFDKDNTPHAHTIFYEDISSTELVSGNVLERIIGMMEGANCGLSGILAPEVEAWET